MTRGNQRDIARAKNQKKVTEQKRGARGDDGLSVEQRKMRDAEVMREKQKKKEDDKVNKTPAQ